MSQALGYGFLALGFAGAVGAAIALCAALLSHRIELAKPVRLWVGLIGLAAVGSFSVMEVALFQRDFTLDYVRQVGSHATPSLYNFAALWSSLEGSLLLWVLILSVLVCWFCFRFWSQSDQPIFGWALVVQLAVVAFFFALLLGPANPFSGGPVPPGFVDGQGPNPLLQNHILVAFHPPLLYLGYVGFTIPFSIAIAALICGERPERWLASTRRTTTISWVSLTFGIILGAWWSYEVLGWGGFWAWDPVENASLLPWLTATAFLHTVLAEQRSGLMRVWNLSLVCATFCLTLFGTFLTRSGVFDSVHAFSDSDIGPVLLGGFVVAVLVSLVLIVMRVDSLGSSKTIRSAASVEALFLGNNFLLVAIATVVLAGTTFPLLIELIDNSAMTVARPYFDTMVTPLALALLTLMALAPVVSWGQTPALVVRRKLALPAASMCVVTAVVVLWGVSSVGLLVCIGLAVLVITASGIDLVSGVRRHKWRGLIGRRSGAMVAHIGVAVLALGLAASETYRTDQAARMRIGEPIVVDGHSFEYQGVSRAEDSRRQEIAVKVLVDEGRVYEPKVTRYRRAAMVVPTPSVRSGFSKDIYLVVDEAPADDTAPIRLRIITRPMVSWLWAGGTLMCVGAILGALGKGSSNSIRYSEVPSDHDEVNQVSGGENHGA